jgi:MYXO-CTERM domain-containing protein
VNFRSSLFAAVFLIPAAAFAQGEPVPCATGGPTGGAVTEEGECDGADAIFCGQDGNVVRIPCGALGEGAPVGVCEVYPNFGSWCAFSDGDGCAFQDQAGDVTTFACATDTSACIDGVCTAGSFACTPTPQGSNPEPACLDGDNLSFGCFPWSQPSVVACSGVDAAATCSGNVCAGIADGGVCVDGVAECADGLTCEGQTADAPGACGTGGGGGGGGGGGDEGEGEGEGDDADGGNARDDQAEPAGGLCAQGSVAGALPLAALALLLARRRRR